MKQLAWDHLVAPQTGPGSGAAGHERKAAGPGELWMCRGARRAERALLERVALLQREVAARPTLLRQPVLVVVPSGSLRQHLVRQVVAQGPSACLGLAVITLRALAGRILERACIPATITTEGWCDLVSRREAAREEHLQALLAAFDDGFSLASSSVRDLLSAGLREDDAPLLAQIVEDAQTLGHERGGAIARAACRTRAFLDREALMRPGDSLQRAAETLAQRGGGVLSARAVLVYGFADATGQATALLQELLRAGATVWIDEPPELRPHLPRAERFTDQLVSALELVVPAREIEPADPNSVTVRIDSFDALGADAECMEVAQRIQELCAGGAVAERIAVIARDLSRYALPLRRACSRRGVPFSATRPLSQAVFSAQRRWRVARRLLNDGLRCPVDDWLFARVWERREGRGDLSRDRDDLRLLFRALGVGLLEDAAALSPGAGLSRERLLRLPRFVSWVEAARRERSPTHDPTPPSWQGGDEQEACSSGDDDADEPLEPGEDAQEDEPADDALWTARCVPYALLERAQLEAAALVEHLSLWPDSAPVAVHVEHAQVLLARHLGWGSADAEGAAVPPDWSEGLADLARVSPERIELTRDEFRILLGGLRLAEEPIGGAGSGVQVFDVTQARGLTFAHVFLLGFNRSVFPRTIREDPLLPDPLRSAFRAVLPDLACKGRGQLEERHLFAELLSAAPHVTLSWLREDAHGRSFAPSPLLYELASIQREHVHLPGGVVTRLDAPWAGTRARPRSALEAMQLAGSAAVLELCEALRPQQVREAVRRAQLLFADESLEEATPLGPVAGAPPTTDGASSPATLPGFLGAETPTDKRARPLFITTLEAYAACPWRALLRGLLRIAPLPDPLSRLPAIDARLVGNVVHGTLERLLAPGQGGPLLRPAEALVVATTSRVAREIAEQEGVLLPALQRAMATVALPLVERAIALDWPHPAARVQVLAVEQLECLELADERGRLRDVSFKIDRVDDRDGVRVLTDYKTGSPLAPARREATRARQLERAVRAATRLQIAAYAAAAARRKERAVGRYVFLDPTVPAESAELRVTQDDPLVQEGFSAVMALLLSGWRDGLFFPRLEDKKGAEPPRCARCEVAEACTRGDSEARGELRALVGALAARRAGGEPLSSEQHLLLELWQLA